MRKAAAAPSISLLAFALTVGAMAVNTVVSAPVAHAATTTGALRGTIRNSDTGAPVRGALVQLFTPGVSSAIDSTKTDSNGVYTFTGEQTGSYNLVVTSQGSASVQTPITLLQNTTVTQDFTLSLSVVKGGHSTITVSPVARNQTQTVFNVTEKDEEQREPNPSASYQFPGLLVGVPGVTFDPSGGYPHLLGADENETGFQVDGIPNTEGLNNEFATNIVTVGLKDADVETGGSEDSSNGGALGGTVNEITKSGRDLVSAGKPYGGDIESENGPGHGWNYTGSNDDIGGILFGGKLDYYASTTVFRNRFPNNFEGLDALPDSYDGLYKLNYYATKNDTFTGYIGKGNEEYEDANDNSPDQFQPDQNNFEKLKDNFKTHSMQSYKTAFFSYQHKFNAKSFIQYRIANQPDRLQVYLGADGEYEGWDNNKTFNELSYQNQITPQNRVNLGYQYTPYSSGERLLFSDTAGPYAQDTELSGEAGLLQSVYGFSTPIPTDSNGYLEEDTHIKQVENAVYLDDQYKPFGQKVTLTAGIRDDQMKYETNREGDFTKFALDPRLGAAYSPTNDFVVRANYGLTSEFAGARYAEFGGPAQEEFEATAGDSAFSNAVSDFLDTPTKPNSSVSYNTQVGLTKGFSIKNPILGGSYALDLIGYQRNSKDLLERIGTTGAAGETAFGLNNGPDGLYDITDGGGAYTFTENRAYQSDGTGHASGVEVQLSKRARSKYDSAFNGFLSYTNSTDKATDSFLDTGYYSYFYNAFREVPGFTQAQFLKGLSTEYPTSYDQKHTVFAELNKRVGKIVNFHINLDAGSGFPFANGVTNVVTGESLATINTQHSNSLSNGMGTFNTVPILLPNGTLESLNPTPGRTGWHYKFTLNTDFDVTPTTTFFFNVDNPFDRHTALILAPVTEHGDLFYRQPTFAHPQGQVYYGPNTQLIPVYVSFGVRLHF